MLEELIKLARKRAAATKRGVDLSLTDNEVAFYDALVANESAVIAMGDGKLKVIAAELICCAGRSSGQGPYPSSPHQPNCPADRSRCNFIAPAKV